MSSNLAIEDFDEIELAEDYDSEDLKSIQGFISKELGIPVEIKGGLEEEEADSVFEAWLVEK